MEPTSEQELKQLLEEGRITEEEFQELKRAMAEKGKSQAVEQQGSENEVQSARKLGKIALVLTLGGIALPAIIYNLVNMRSSPNSSPAIWPFVILYFGMELAGFVMGIIAWKDGLGKAAAITAGTFMILSVLFAA